MRNLLRPVPLFPLLLVAVILAGCPKKKHFHPEPDLRGFGEFVVQDVRGAGWNTQAVVLGDVDGDGDLDAFVANYGEQNRLLVNDGSGEFSDGTDPGRTETTGLPLILDRSRCAFFGDVDNDGDIDIVVGNNGQNLLLINDGHGEFTDGTDLAGMRNTGLPSGTEDTWALALVNVDGEGGYDADLDLVLVNEGQDRLYLNDGNGEFLDGTDLGSVYTTGLPMDGDPGRGLLVVNVDADVSGDTDADLVILNEGSPNRLLINSTGLGEFTDASFDTLTNAASLSPLAENSRAAAAADINGDGLIDLIVANEGRNRILLNKGAGFFTDGSSEWRRERVMINGRLNSIHGTFPVPTSVVTVGRTFDGSPISLFGAVRQSPGNGTWNVVGANVSQSELYAAWAAPGSADAYAVGQGGTVLSNRNTVPVGTWVDLAQAVTGVDLFAASGTSATNVYFAGDEGTVIHYDGSSFTIEREFTRRDLLAVWGDGSGGFMLGGQAGTILAGGAAGFSRQTSGTNVQIADMWGDSATNMYAVGTGGTVLHRWTQGGTQPLAWYPESTSILLSLNAVTGRSGEVWCAGDYDFQANEFTILRDQGSGWTAVSPGFGYGENILAIWVDPASGDFFAAGGNEALLRWDASAATWFDDTPASPSTMRYVAMHGTSASNVVVVGENGSLAHFNGTSWTRHDVTPATTSDLSGIWLESPTLAWVTSSDGKIYRLDLSSWTWTTVSPAPTVRYLFDIWGESAADVYAVGEKGTLLHYDGASWRIRESGRIDALFALDATHIWAVGPAGLVLEGDGAGNWSAHAGVPTTADLLAVWASTLDQNVWAVGKEGTVLHYDTSSWTVEGAPTGFDLHAVWGNDGGASNLVWAGGDQGVFIENSGTGWVGADNLQRLWVGTTDRITGIWGSTSNNLFACTYSGCLFHYTGTPASVGFVSEPAGDSWDVACLPLNGDSYPDIIFANEGQNTAWVNNGFGVFTEETGARLPADADLSRSLAREGPYKSGNSWSMKSDLDGDGDADFAVANERSQNRLLLNLGNGSFTDGTDIACALPTGFPAVPLSTDAVIGDVNGDGRLDVVVARKGSPNRLYINAGGGSFVDAEGLAESGLPADTDPTLAAALADVDGDGDLDVIFASDNGPQRLYLNDGAGLFTEPSPLLLPADVFRATDVFCGDLDGDGDPDLVFSVSGARNRLYRFSGGVFVDASALLPADADDTRACAVLDVNGDDTPDIVFVNDGAQNRLFMNHLALNGTFPDGTFGLVTHLPPDTDPTWMVLGADLDGNGHPDLVFVNRGAQDLLLINDGHGYFTDGTDLGQILTTGLPAAAHMGRAGVLVDVDHDGDFDLVVGNDGQQNRLYLNDGSGEFTDGTDEIGAAPHGFPADAADTTALAAGDLDGDKDPDLFATHLGADQILFNR